MHTQMLLLRGVHTHGLPATNGNAHRRQRNTSRPNQGMVVTGKGTAQAHPGERPYDPASTATHPPCCLTALGPAAEGCRSKQGLFVLGTCFERQLAIHCLADATLSAVACGWSTKRQTAVQVWICWTISLLLAVAALSLHVYVPLDKPQPSQHPKRGRHTQTLHV